MLGVLLCASWTSASVQAAGLVGLTVAGPLVDRFEPRPLVAVAAAVGLLTSVACLVVVRRETPPAAVAPGWARDFLPAFHMPRR